MLTQPLPNGKLYNNQGTPPNCHPPMFCDSLTPVILQAREEAMKLLIYGRGPYDVATNATTAWGGAEKQQWVISRELVRRGHEVTIIVNTNAPDDIQSEVEGVRFIKVPAGNSLTKLYTALQQENPDWYYRRTAKESLGPSVMIAKTLGVRSVYASAYDTDCTPRQALQNRKYLWPLYKLGLDLCDSILVQHSHQMKLLSPAYQRKAHQVNNIVDIPAELPPKQDYVSWIVAALRYPKRPHLLVEIAKALPQVKFVVCGVPTSFSSSMDYGNRMVEAFNRLPNVDYRGSVPPDEARRIISESLVFLSTSDGEGFPNTMLEAWSGYTPVVSLELDPGDVIARHKTGLVVNSVEEFVEELSALLSDTERREQLGRHGRAYVENEHSAARAYEQLQGALGF
ncbi:glycosyltransferase family 4 protein [bacterium]|nr:glycosyltransferase family 4 protein [bacterium]